MALQLTLGRTTFLVRREPAKPVAQSVVGQQPTPSFAKAWMQTFNGTWQAKAGACSPKQLLAEQNTTETDETHDQE